MAGNEKSGRRPKSIKMLKISGNFRQDRHRTIKTDLPIGAPRAPLCIKKNPIALREWRRIIKLLGGTEYMGKLDLAVLMAYVLEFAKYTQVNQKLIEISSMLTKSTKQTIIISPLIRLSDRSLNNMMKCISELGFSPLSRRCLRIEPRTEKNEKSRFFEKKA